MKDKKLPLPVRFDPSVMEKCKEISKSSQSGFTASEIARDAMRIGLNALGEWVVGDKNERL